LQEIKRDGKQFEKRINYWNSFNKTQKSDGDVLYGHALSAW